MTRKKTMGRSGGNRSTHTTYDQQVVASLNQINAEIDKIRGRLEDPFYRHVRKAERIKLFPQDLKTCGVTHLMYWLKRDLTGGSNGAYQND
jgi:hypothetical protein